MGEEAIRYVPMVGAVVGLIAWIVGIRKDVDATTTGLRRHEDTCDVRYREMVKALQDEHGAIMSLLDVSRIERREDIQSVRDAVQRVDEKLSRLTNRKG